MIKKLGLIAVSITLTACTTLQNETRITSDIKAREFNSIASKYYERPTFVTLENMSDGETLLAFKMDSYRSVTNSIRFSKNDTTDYKNIITKFSEWNQLATERGDAFTKEIGRVSTWGNGLSATLKFEFHSGNEKQHYLSVSYCAAGTCLDDSALYFDKQNSEKLYDLLVKLEKGEVEQKDIDSIYN